MVKKKLSLTIVIPVYNEKNRISLSIKALNNFRSIDGLLIKEVRFVNDGSADDTLQILKNTKFKIPTKIISYFPNRGRGFAVKKGMENIKTDYAMYIDSDMAIPLNNLQIFFNEIKKGTEVIVGSKKMKDSVCTKERSKFRKIAGLAHSLIFSIFLGMWVYDFQGGFKVLSKKAVNRIFPKIRLSRWGMDPEVIFIARKAGLSFKELPVVWNDTQESTITNPLKEVTLAFRDLTSIILNNHHGKYN